MTDQAAPMRPAPAMTGLTVLDLSDSVGGNFCARMFADNGASVAYMEPPSGSRLRRQGPAGPAVTGAPASFLFGHLHQGKQLLTPTDPGELLPLLGQADVVVADSGQDPDDLASAGARLICRITPFGADEMPGLEAGELIYQAASGTMYENGLPGRRPLYGVGHRASYAAGVAGYIQAVAVLLSGSRAVHIIDVSIAEVAASMAFNRITHYSYNGSVLGRDAKETQRTIVRAADGWLGAFVDDRRWALTCRALGLADLIDDECWSTLTARADNWAAFERALESRTKSRPVQELLAAGQQAKAVISRSVRLTELREFPQLTARRWWPELQPGEPLRLGPMFRFSATPQAYRHGPGITIASSVADVLAAWTADRVDARLPAATRHPASRPLSGIRIVDLTSAWAGPMATRILAALGADVIKIEGPARLDDWRGAATGGPADRYPDMDPGSRPYDRHFQFNTQNHDKRALVLNLKHPAGLAAVLRLAARSDVVIANFSVGTLERMGLSFGRVSEASPGAVLVEMPAYGSDGPISTYVAYGPSMELMSGMAGTIGYGDGKPVTTGPAYLDPMGGLHGAAATLTALYARRMLGTGQHVEVAQTEAALHWIGELVLAAASSGQDPEPDGNRHPAAAPHDTYRCAGEDEWIAIAAYNDGQFARLCSALGLGPLHCDVRFRTAQARVANADQLDALIGQEAASQNKHALERRLRAAAVPAAAVLNARDLYSSDYLQRRGLAYEIDHPAAGRHRYQGLPLHISGFDLSARRPAPLFGQHSDEILTEGGFTEAEICQLRCDKVVTDVPLTIGPS